MRNHTVCGQITVKEMWPARHVMALHMAMKVSSQMAINE